MRRRHAHFTFFIFLGFSILIFAASDGGSAPLYLEADRPLERRVDDLLKRMTLAEKIGQLKLPVYYNRPPSKKYWLEKGWGRPYVDMNPEPLHPFGFGLSYTRFEFSNPRISPTIVGRNDSVRVTVDVKNVGERDGAAVAQLYLNDVLSSVVTPVKELKGFARVQLKAGQKKEVAFLLKPDDLSLIDARHQRVVEPGAFEITIGPNSREIALRGAIECK